MAKSVIERLQDFPKKESYHRDDIQSLLDHNFQEGLLIIRLFLGLSDDAFGSLLRSELGPARNAAKPSRTCLQRFLDWVVALVGDDDVEGLDGDWRSHLPGRLLDQILHWRDRKPASAIVPLGMSELGAFGRYVCWCSTRSATAGSSE